MSTAIATTASASDRAEGATHTQIVYCRDAASAIANLTAAFGFQHHHSERNADGSLRYALLVLGRGTIMLIPAQQDEPHHGSESQIAYFTVANVDDHYARAKARSAEIVSPLQDLAYGGRGYAARAVDGHIWSFGTFDPRPEPSALVAAPSIDVPRPRWAPKRALGLMAVGCAGFMAGLVAFAGYTRQPIFASAGVASVEAAIVPSEAERSAKALAKEWRARARAFEKSLADAERSTSTARADLESERAAKELAKKTLSEVEGQLSAERSARGKSDAAAEDLRKQMTALETALTESQSTSETAVANSNSEQGLEIAELRRQLGETQKNLETAEQLVSKLQQQVVDEESRAEVVAATGAQTVGELRNRVRILEAALQKAAKTAAEDRKKKPRTATSQKPATKTADTSGEPETGAVDNESSGSSGQVPYQGDPEPWEYSSPLWQDVRKSKEKGN